MKTTTHRSWMLALALVIVPLSARDAIAASKEECLASHESSQLLRRRGQLRAAREKLVVCSDEACPKIVRSACADWLEEVDASTPSIVVEAHGVGGRTMSEVRVAMDGVGLLPRLDGRAVSVDPGEHRFVLESRGGEKRELVVVVPEGRKNWPIVADFAPRDATRDDGEEERRLAAERSRRTLGFVVGGIGVAALAVGGAFGVLAISADQDAVCPSPCREHDANGAPNATLAQARDAGRRADTFAWVSDIALGAGLVGLAAGAYLVLTARGTRSDAPRRTSTVVVPASLDHGGGLFVEGAF